MGILEKANILLVDDQPSRLLTYEAVLGELEENLVFAHSGSEALAKLLDQEFAVVLLDVRMPGLDGFEVATLMRSHPRSKKTPVIFVTGVQMSDSDRLKGYKLGAVDYVNIPIVPEVLRSKVVVFTELYRQRKELQGLNRQLSDAYAQLEREHNSLLVQRSRELEALNLTLRSANVGLLRELTEHGLVEELLKQADRRKDEFLATLAHELRNPLGAALNALQAVRAISVADPKIDHLHELLQRQLTAAARMINDLWDVSRIAYGEITLTRQPVEFVTLVESAIETMSSVLQKREHEVAVDFPDRGLRVDADPARLMQAVGNLLGNAAKYTDRGGHIAVSAQKEGMEVVLRIADTGIGIPADRLPVIFDLFTQIHPESAAGQSGLGIGLALVRRLIEAHGGRISAHSEGSGRGSEFVIHLPLLPETTDNSLNIQAAP